MIDLKKSFHVEALMDKEKLKKEFFIEAIEVRNETDELIWATAVKSELTGQIYVHILKDEGFMVKPHGYKLVPIEIEKISVQEVKETKQ
jgi:hypothetical protein